MSMYNPSDQLHGYHQNDALMPANASCLESPRHPDIGWTERERAAFHEAGHAVTAVVLPNARNLEGVSISLDHDRSGRTFLTPEPSTVRALSHKYLFAEAVVFAAGPTAERFATGSSGECDGDERQIELLSRWHPSPAKLVIRTAKRRSERLVFNHWRAIRALADTLLQHGVVSANHVRWIMGRCPTEEDRVRDRLLRAMREVFFGERT